MPPAIDYNDVAFVVEKIGTPIGFTIPAPNESRFKMKDGTLCSVFHEKPIYYKHLSGSWRPMSEVAYHYGTNIILKEDWDSKMSLGFLAWLSKFVEISIPTPRGFMPVTRTNIFFTTTDFFSVPGSGAIDGDVYKDPAATWTLARDAATGSAAQFPLDQDWICYSDHTAVYGVLRGFHNFDTSSITSAATVTAATMSIMGGNPLSRTDTNSTTVEIVPSTISDPSTLTTANFSEVTFSSLGNWTFASMTQDVYSSTAISDLTKISKTGVTKLATMTGRDLANNAPTGLNEISGYYSDHTGTSKDPKLTVTYTLPASGGFFMFM